MSTAVSKIKISAILQQHKDLFFLRFTLLFCMLNRKVDFTILSNIACSIQMGIVDIHFLFWVIMILFCEQHWFYQKNTEDNIIKTLDFWIQNIFWFWRIYISIDSRYSQWIIIVHRYLIICFCTRMTQSSFKTF